MITPSASGRKSVALLGDRVLCVSVWPFVKSARVLYVEGYPAKTVIELWRPDARDWALRGRLGAVAATLIDGEIETASRRAKNGLPVRKLQKASRRVAKGRRVSTGPSWADDDALERGNPSRRANGTLHDAKIGPADERA
ncbi:MAG: hypothetical protein WBQ55_00510 [Xanthobacteraceae bacterium]